MEEKLDKIIEMLEELNSSVEDLKNEIYFKNNKPKISEKKIDEIFDAAIFKIDENGNIVKP